MSERKGTGGVQPHNAILKGEMLDRIIIRNNTIVTAENIVIRLYSSATVWEFRKEVSKMIDLSPKYVRFELPDGTRLKDSMNGMVLEQLGLKNGDIITARKIAVVEDVEEIPIIDTTKRELIPRAQEIFGEWFDKYKDPEIGKLTHESATKFVLGATLEDCPVEDNRITGMFNTFAKKDPTHKTMEKDEFLKIYYNTASSIN